MKMTWQWRLRAARWRFQDLVERLTYWVVFVQFKVQLDAAWLPGCSHGPKQWRWWHLFAVSVVQAQVVRPSYAWNVWVYRPGEEGKNRGRCCMFVVDRRVRVQRVIHEPLP